MTAAQLKFAAGVASGLPVSEAYTLAFPNSKHPRKDASRLLSPKSPAKPGILAEIKRIRSEAERLAGGAVLTLMEKRMFLARVVRACIANTPLDSDLWQEMIRTRKAAGKGGDAGDAGEWETEKLKFADKLRAIALDNDLAGDGADAELRITITRAWGGEAPAAGEVSAAA